MVSEGWVTSPTSVDPGDTPCGLHQGGILVLIRQHGPLTSAQSSTVLNNAAEVARALVVLDKRYEHIPGWIPLRGRGRLDRAAQVCGVFAEYDSPDYSVDHKGWRPPPATIEGGPLPGIGGVLQAEHNLLVHLSTFPNALNLRRELTASGSCRTKLPAVHRAWRQR